MSTGSIGSLGIVTPVSQNPDCTVVHDASCDLYAWLKAQPAVKEESLTDRLLYEIDRHSKHFTYKAFTRHEEARKTGADWEWWILMPTYALRLRVQAKKTHGIPYDHYKDLAYTNKYGLQIQKLLTDAKATNSVPLYALYATHATAMLLCPKGAQSEGAFLASADRIFKSFIATGPAPVGVDDLLKIATPLSCLICCIASSDPAAFIYHYFPEGLSPAAAGQLRQGLYAFPPRHIAALLEARDQVPDWWEREYARQFEGVDAVLVYDGRNRLKEQGRES